jgi:hypothetical protein
LLSEFRCSPDVSGTGVKLIAEVLEQGEENGGSPGIDLWQVWMRAIVTAKHDLNRDCLGFIV